MESNELNSMISGYVAGNVISKTVSNNLQKYIDETEEWLTHHPQPDDINGPFSKYLLSNDIDGGNKFINDWMMEELVHYAQHQEKLASYLGDLIDKVKVKYSPYYARMQRTMPGEFANMTAQSLCDAVGVPLLKTKEEFIKERERKNKRKDIRRYVIYTVLAIIGVVLLITLFNS